MAAAREPPEIMMPVADDQALRLAEIEALRAIRDSVHNQAKHTQALTDEVREQRNLITDVRERVIRIESSSVIGDVTDLKTRVDALERVNDRREGAKDVALGAVKVGPTLIVVLGVIVFVMLVLIVNGKL